MSKKESTAISNIRVVSMIMILVSHYFQGTGNVKLVNLSYFDIYAVVIFMFLSGYLSNSKENKNFLSFFMKRWIRIMIPVYIFFLFVFSVSYLQTGIALYHNEFFSILFGLFAFSNVNGGTHLWFVSILLICTATTPLMFKVKKGMKQNNGWITTGIVITLFIAEAILFLKGTEWKYLEYLFAGFSYSMGFFYKDFLKERMINRKHYVAILVLSLATLVLRFKLQSLGTVLFAHTAMLANCYLTSILIMETIYGISGEHKNVVIRFLEKNSYSLYIVHPLVLFGPVLMIYYTASLNNLFEAIFITVLGAVCLTTASDFCVSKLQKYLKRFNNYFQEKTKVGNKRS